jgi:hypothetical protein
MLLALSGSATASMRQSGPVGPTSEQVEAMLYYNAGQVCRDLIDACLDEEGNSLIAFPDFHVSQLACDAAVAGRKRCVFQSEQRYGERIARRERCTAWFVPDVPGTGWALEATRRPTRRTSLDCK